jgi:hypothetical protein
VAEAHGVVAERIDDWRKLEGRLDATETQVLVVPVDRAASVDRHRELWSAVAAAIGSSA